MTSRDTTLDAAAEAHRDALAGRLVDAAVATADLQAVYLGLRLGLYQALADGGPRPPRSSPSDRAPSLAMPANGWSTRPSAAS